MDCRVPSDCIAWPCPPPDTCDPCIDPDNPDHVFAWESAWKSVASFLYWETGEKWPGTCFEETVRPCIRESCGCKGWGGCYHCGVYNYLPLDSATCLPIVGLKEVWVGPNPCNGQTEQTWIDGGDVRLEYVGGPRLVIQNDTACCGDWPKQDLCSPTGGEGTWHVTLFTGADPPRFVLDGAADMANELVRQCITMGCKLPGNVTRKTFDGTTVEIDPDRGATLQLQMLQQLLDKVHDRPVEQFSKPSNVVFHRVAGPTRSDECPNVDC